MNDQSRKEFEAWATENGMGLHLDRSESGLYVSPVTQKFLGCWVASQTALINRQEQEHEEFLAHFADYDHEDRFHG